MKLFNSSQLGRLHIKSRRAAEVLLVREPESLSVKLNPMSNEFGGELFSLRSVNDLLLPASVLVLKWHILSLVS